MSRLLKQMSTVVRQAPTSRLTFGLIAITLAVAVPLLSVWQVAQSMSIQVRPVENPVPLRVSPITAVFSIRRIPQTLIDLESKAKVTAELDTVVSPLTAQSCLVVSSQGQIIYSLNPDLAVIPASNQKLLTGAVALDVIGSEYRFTTQLKGLVRGSSVVGDLWIVGSGDPLLSTKNYPLTEKYPTLTPTFIEPLIDALVAAGVTSVVGGVVGDDSIYDRERYVPTWGDGLRSVEVGPLGALMLNDGVMMGSPLKLENPALGVATEFTRMLIARGIAVRDAPRVGVADSQTTTIAKLESVPLKEVVAEMLTNSDNNTAELLVKEIGRVGHGSATRIDGLQVIAEKISLWGLPTQGITLFDGSGLDRGNRLTCSLITSLLSLSTNEVIDGLALAGSTGTLKNVFLTGPAYAVLRAKTGTLNGVKALSGVFPLANGSTTIFSLILNQTNASNESVYRPIWHDLTKALGQTQVPIDIDDVSPTSP